MSATVPTRAPMPMQTASPLQATHLAAFSQSTPPQPAAPRWAQHLANTNAIGSIPHTGARQPPLTTAEAARVQRHHDLLMAALRTQDRLALMRAKQALLDEVYRPQEVHRGNSVHGGHNDHEAREMPGASGCEMAICGAAESPALRRALRDLSWRMAALLVARSPAL